MKTLGLALYGNNNYLNEYCIDEILTQGINLYDEVVFIDGDSIDETMDMINIHKDNYLSKNKKFKIYKLPWRDSFRKNMMLLTRTAAMSQIESDYILYMDADELLLESQFSKIKNLINLDNDAYSFQTLHFWRDYNHIKDYVDNWYNYRPKLVKNGLGIWDGYQSWIDKTGNIQRNYTSDLTTWDYKPVYSFAEKSSIVTFHYGWILSSERALEKYNSIELRHHPDGSTKKIEWNWGMESVKEFKANHPEAIKEKIKRHKEKYSQYYK